MGKGGLWVVVIRVSVMALCLIEITVLEMDVFKGVSNILYRVMVQCPEDSNRGNYSSL